MEQEINDLNKDIINDLVNTYNFGYLELENLADNIKTYISLCKKEGRLVAL